MLVLFLVCYSTPSFAEANRPGTFGLGLILGDPTGVSAKYWLDKSHAIDAAIGFGNFSIHADYLWHKWDMFPQPQSGKLAAYWGLGAEITDYRGDRYRDRDTEFGIRAMGGVAYHFPRDPVEVFLQVVPVLLFSHDSGINVDAGLGIRYYFH